MTRRLVFLVVLLVAAVAAWEFASPWWTLWSMRQAARNREAERLSSFIDYARVKSSLRGQLLALAEAKGPAPAFENFIRRAGAGVIIDPVVDAIVSPEALRPAFVVRPDRERDATTNRKCGVDRETLERFRVRCAQLAKGKADLIFEREGLGWRLVGIDLPDDYGATVS